MNVVRPIGWAVVGFVVTSALIWAVRAAPEGASSASASATTSSAEGFACDTPEDRALADLRRRVATANAELWAGRLAEAAAVGEPMEWPEGAPASHEEIAVDLALQAAAEFAGAEVLALDCGEYPCVAVVALTAGLASNRAVDAELESRGYVTWGTMGSVGEGDEELFYQVVAFPAPDEEEPDLDRMNFRYDDLLDAIEPDLVALVEGEP